MLRQVPSMQWLQNSDQQYNRCVFDKAKGLDSADLSNASSIYLTLLPSRGQWVSQLNFSGQKLGTWPTYSLFNLNNQLELIFCGLYLNFPQSDNYNSNNSQSLFLFVFLTCTAEYLRSNVNHDLWHYISDVVPNNI